MKYIKSCINIAAIVKRNTFSIINSNRFLLITGSAHNNNKGCYNGFCRFSFLVLGRWIFFHQDSIISLDQVFLLFVPENTINPIYPHVMCTLNNKINLFVVHIISILRWPSSFTKCLANSKETTFASKWKEYDMDVMIKDTGTFGKFYVQRIDCIGHHNYMGAWYALSIQ